MRGKFPVQDSGDGEEGEEGRDGDGSIAHSKSHQESLCQPPKEVVGVSQHEEQNADDSGMSGHQGLQQWQDQDHATSLKKDPTMKIKWVS